jgi:hypothetical protein
MRDSIRRIIRTFAFPGRYWGIDERVRNLRLELLERHVGSAARQEELGVGPHGALGIPLASC